MPPAIGALSDIVIVDLTRQMAGPYATMVLGDFGADVIKIESPPQGDPSRRMGPRYPNGETTMFLTWNRSKRSLCVDLRRSEGVALVCKLVEKADVLVENFRPGVADEMGLGWDRLRELNPRLVYVSVSAFGSNGPWRDRPGTDPAVQAMSGVMSVTGEPDGPPVLVGVPFADFTGAMLAVQSCLLGLVARQSSGKGQRVQTSMLGGLLFALTTRVGPFFMTGQDPVRWGGQHSQVVPYGAFKTADGWAVVGVWGEEFWQPFCEALGCPELATDARFDSNTKRVERREEINSIVSKQMMRRTTGEWEEDFSARRALFAPVNTFSQIFNHPQVAANGLVTELEHPTLGPLKSVAPVIRMDDTPALPWRPPPRLGEHSNEVLKQFGWSESEVAELSRGGIIHG